MSEQKSAARVQEELNQFGLELQVIEMETSTRTAQEAALTVGCRLGQIAKSLIFRGKLSGEPILVIASGANRVNERRIAGYIGEPITKADADYVLCKTGYVIGGIPPIGHKTKLSCLVDQELLQYEEIWGAAGTPYAVFRLTPTQLLTITGGKVVEVV